MPKLEPSVVRSYTRKGNRSVLPNAGTLSEVFHENTKLTPLSSRAYGRHIGILLGSPSARLLMENPFKTYSLGDQVELPPLAAATEIEQVLVERRSLREFTGEAITKDELARLLHFTYGLAVPGSRLRPIASPGALYPLELYIIPNRVQGLERWVYHYSVEHNALDVVARTDRWPQALESIAVGDMKDPDQASLILVITAVVQRATFKYLDRGYRMILMEAGEAGHNISLLATSLGLGGYMIGGFIDDEVADLLEIDGVDEVPLIPMALGRKASNGG